MHISQLPEKIITFTHIDEKTNEQTVIWIDGLVNSVKKKVIDGELELVKFDIDADFAEWVLNNRGIERHRLKRLTADNMNEPVMFLDWWDDSHLLVDGNHRYVRHWQLGIKEGIGVIVPKRIWRNFVITGIPIVTEEFLKTSFSGIL